MKTPAHLLHCLLVGLVLSATSQGLIGQGTPPSTAPAMAAAVAATPMSNADLHRLQAQDRLRFQILEDPAQTNEMTEVIVSASGELRFPVSRGFEPVVRLKVRGKTVGEVKAELKVLLDADYYHDAHLILQPSTVTPAVGKVQFSGVVNGAYPLTPGQTHTLAKALQMFGDLSGANLKQVKIRRTNPVTRKANLILVNVQKVIDEKAAEDPALQEGDWVEVPGITRKVP